MDNGTKYVEYKIFVMIHESWLMVMYKLQTVLFHKDFSRAIICFYIQVFFLISYLIIYIVQKLELFGQECLHS